MAKYLLRKKAVEDLSQIWNFTCEKWSEKQADDYYTLLVAAFENISGHPAAGKYYPALGDQIQGRRIGSHLIMYRSSTENSIEILRILHRRMDLRAGIGE